MEMPRGEGGYGISLRVPIGNGPMVSSSGQPRKSSGHHRFTRLDPGCGDARVGGRGDVLRTQCRRLVFTDKNSTGRSPIFILTVFRTFADCIARF